MENDHSIPLIGQSFDWYTDGSRLGGLKVKRLRAEPKFLGLVPIGGVVDGRW